jgi:hypothetical protein
MSKTCRADELTFYDVGGMLRWTVPDPSVLIEQQTPFREVGWIGFDGASVIVGLWPGDDDESEAFEQFALEPATSVEVTND